MIEADPERDVQRMLLDLFNIAGYGVHSGIHPGPKADEAIDYILKKLRSAGLTNARLDPVKVNDAFPKSFAMNVNSRGEKTRPVSGFPKTRPNTPLKVRIAVLSDTVHAGDKVWAADDDMVFSDDKTCYRYPGLPDWPSLKWDWGGAARSLLARGRHPRISMPGNFTITMTFTDTEGAIVTDTRQIKVLNAPSIGRKRS